MSFKILVTVVAGFCLGVGIGVSASPSIYTIFWLLGMSLVVALWRFKKNERSFKVLGISIVFLTLALGMIRILIHDSGFSDPLSPVVDTEITIEGTVVLEPDRRTSLQLLTVESNDTQILVSTDLYTTVQYGDHLRISGTISYPKDFATDLGRTFAYRQYLLAKGIEYTMSFAEVEVLESGQGNLIVTKLLALKSAFMRELDQVLFEPAGALADGLLLGVNQGLGDSLEEAFRKSGIVHIVVLSGHNIMLVVTFVIFILSFFFGPRTRLLAGLSAIIAFALIVGLSATVVRASIMAVLLLIAQTFGKTYDVFRSLLVAGLLMVLVNPYTLFDIGFQLSFVATVGLILALPWMVSNEQPELITTARGYILATIATQIAVMPLLIYHIGEVSVVAVLVNLLVLPIVPFAMFGSFLAGVVHFIWPTGGIALGGVTQLLLLYILRVAELFANLPFATIQFESISAWWLLVLYSCIGYGYFWLRNRYGQPKNILKGWEIIAEDSLTTTTK